MSCAACRCRWSDQPGPRSSWSSSAASTAGASAAGSPSATCWATACTAVPTVRVNLASSPYNVVVEPGLIGRVGDWLSSLVSSKVAVVVFDAGSGCYRVVRAYADLTAPM